MTVAIFVIKATELVSMSDPSLQLYSRPIYESESVEKGDINLAEYKVNLGIVTDFSESDLEEIPAKIGRFTSYIKEIVPDSEPELIEHPLVPCSGLFGGINEAIKD